MATALISSGNPTVIRNETSIGKKIDLLTAGALPYYNSLFKNVFQKNKQNAKIICDFIISEIDNQNIKVSTKITHLKVLCWFSKYLNNKEFQSVKREDVTNYLTSLRKTEFIDPSHKWIGTYNTRQMILNKIRTRAKKQLFRRIHWLNIKNEEIRQLREPPARLDIALRDKFANSMRTQMVAYIPASPIFTVY